LPGRRGFTLIELVVAVAIIALLLISVGAAWRSITESSVELKAINTISAYAAVARTYAMRHQLETVLTIDPRTGQLDLFVWDTAGEASTSNIRYVHAPVLDDAARIPNRGDPNRPDNLYVRIVPIDYDDCKYAGGDPRMGTNLARLTLCFDAHGRLIKRALELNPPDPNAVLQDIVRSHLGPGAVQPDDQWFYVESARGGIAYVPASDADFYDPGNIPVDPNDPDREDFMLNQYTGRAMTQEVR